MTSEQLIIDYIEDYAKNRLSPKETEEALDWLETQEKIGAITQFTYERLRRIVFKHFYEAF